MQQVAVLSPGLRELALTDEFWMYNYKVHPCPRTDQHQWDSCPYAHPGEKARRRHPSKHQAVHCPYSKAKKPCPAGDDCPCTHSLFEFWLHPDRFRTSICSKGRKCNRQTCFFAHSEADIRVVAHPPPDPLAAENALNALVGNTSGAEDVELPQLDAAALWHLIECHQQLTASCCTSPVAAAASSSDGGMGLSPKVAFNLAAAAVVGTGGGGSDTATSRDRALQSAAACQHVAAAKQLAQSMALSDHQLLPGNSSAGLVASGGMQGPLVNMARTPMHVNPAAPSIWEIDRLPPADSVEQQLQQATQLRAQQQHHQQQQATQVRAQHQQQQQLGKLGLTTAGFCAALGPGHISSGGHLGGGGSGLGPATTLGLSLGLSPHLQPPAVGMTPPHLNCAAGNCTGAQGWLDLLEGHPSMALNAMVGMADLSPMSLPPAAAVSTGHLSTVLMGTQQPLLATQQQLVMGSLQSLEPLHLAPAQQLQTILVQQQPLLQQQSLPALMATGRLGPDAAGGGLVAGSRFGGGGGAMLQQVVNNAAALTGVTGMGMLPLGGVQAIGEDLRNMLALEDQRKLAYYLISGQRA